jgi:ketosteroid isomerase-like protein
MGAQTDKHIEVQEDRQKGKSEMNSVVTWKYGRLVLFAAFVTINCAFVTTAPSATGDEEAVWQLEHSYWEYVKALDVNGYKSLWHEDFVGWPSTASMPMRKDHITDWLEEDRAAQDALRCYKLEPAGFTSVGDVAVTHYHLTEHWVDKSDEAKPRTIKVTHTWLRTKGTWRIIGGMAAVVPTEHVCQ